MGKPLFVHVRGVSAHMAVDYSPALLGQICRILNHLYAVQQHKQPPRNLHIAPYIIGLAARALIERLIRMRVSPVHKPLEPFLRPLLVLRQQKLLRKRQHKIQPVNKNMPLTVNRQRRFLIRLVSTIPVELPIHVPVLKKLARRDVLKEIAAVRVALAHQLLNHKIRAAVKHNQRENRIGLQKIRRINVTRPCTAGTRKPLGVRFFVDAHEKPSLISSSKFT